jgi:putative Mg2+ transporter-C (MgtC) family protein
MLAELHEPTFFDLTNTADIGRVLVRLVVAALLGGLVGIEREQEQKPAGLRTHMLVSLGAALFVVASLEAGMTVEHLSRVLQGLTTGIGFVGGGVILKLPRADRVEGLTTAANLWVAAGLGTAVGMGWLWPAVLAVGLAWLILFAVRRLEPLLHYAPTRENSRRLRV